MTKAVVKVTDYSSNGKFQSLVIDSADTSLINKKFFINYVLPGETAEIEIVTDDSTTLSKHAQQVRLVQVTQPSPNRVEPFCKYYQSCGGCLLQHVEHSTQMELKVNYLNEFWKHYLKNSDQKIEITESIKGKPTQFRNRINLHILKGKVGYYKQYTREIIEVDECPISHSAISNYLTKLHPIGKVMEKIDSTLSIETDGKKVIAVLKIPFDVTSSHLEQIKLALAAAFDNFLIFVKRKKIHVHGTDQLEMEITDFTNGEETYLKFPSGSFSQVNPEINRELIKKVISIVDKIKPASIEDLYAGAGNFSIPLAKKGYKVVAVESDSQLTGLGDKNAIDLGLSKNLSFYNMTVEKYLNIRGEKPVDLIIADPPRIGLLSVAKQLKYAKNLILISCKVESFMEDVKKLEGFEVNEVTAFDMFPHTPHFEVLSLSVK